LTEADFESGRAYGRTLTVAAALAEARHLAQAGPAAMTESPGADPNYDPLTARELQVARLLAQASSDRQVADALGISVRTAGVHVHRVLAKLGLRSRWQVADWLAAQRTPPPHASERSTTTLNG
jgi:DNA-binding NarL/FixJ family response regulator